MRIVIADTSCLILYDKIDRLDILQSTFSEIVTTDKVIEEYGKSFDWLIERDDYDQNAYEKLLKTFGAGESSCIALAQAENSPILVIDDKKAKRIAEEVGIECIGSIGVLLVAKREGILLEIRPVLDQVQATNFRISDRIIDLALAIAGEK